MVSWTVNKVISGVKISSNENKIEYTIFPNPGKDIITLKAMSAKKNFAKVDIVDISGKNYYHFEDANNAKTEFQYEINIASFANGTYFLKLQIGDVVETKAFIKE
jgi:hypothetical protein